MGKFLIKLDIFKIRAYLQDLNKPNSLRFEDRGRTFSEIIEGGT
jgi:hypothetical protein